MCVVCLCVEAKYVKFKCSNIDRPSYDYVFMCTVHDKLIYINNNIVHYIN